MNLSFIINRIVEYIHKADSLIGYFQLNAFGATVGKSLKVRGRLFIRNAGIIEIGDHVRINSADWANPPIGGEKLIFRYLRMEK